MALVVVGGQSRKVGKTSVIAGLICALPELHWTAIKITPHEHGAAPQQDFEIIYENDRLGASDTSRYLAAGAQRAVLVRARPEALGRAMPAIQREIANAAYAMIESNSIVEFVRPDLYLIVVDSGVADVKDSALRFLDQADGFVMDAPPGTPLPASFRSAATGRRVFHVAGSEISDELADFVRARIAGEK